MSNVTPITRRFDADVDTALNLFEDTMVHQAPPTAPIEFGQLLSGPAQPVTRPAQRRKRPAVDSTKILTRASVVVGFYFLGVIHASVIIGCFR